MSSQKTYTLDDALKAQQALRSNAGLEAERFPVAAFVGMISDEIEVLREQGRSDDEIASLIRSSSNIEITSSEVAEHYAPAAERHSRD